MKTLPANAIGIQHRAESCFREYIVGENGRTPPDLNLPDWVRFEDLLEPAFWCHHTKLLKKHDLVHVRAHDGAYSCCVSVEDVAGEGVRMALWPRYPDEAYDRAAKVLPPAVVPSGPQREFRALPAHHQGLKIARSHFYTTWFLDLGAHPALDLRWADLFRPELWAEFVGSDKKFINEGDQIRVRAADGSFDCLVNVDVKSFAGVLIGLPTLPGSDLHARADAICAARASVSAELNATELGDRT